jgi:hypothetical protein
VFASGLACLQAALLQVLTTQLGTEVAHPWQVANTALPAMKGAGHHIWTIWAAKHTTQAKKQSLWRYSYDNKTNCGAVQMQYQFRSPTAKTYCKTQTHCHVIDGNK